ncbi:ribonuclease 3-like protein 3 [Nymphaea colorata]|nr:ribonuclease 3-like protein 3 [Nymphaea colorata]
MEGTPDAPPEDDFSRIVDRVQEKLQYRFADGELVREALTHGSYYYPLKGGVCYDRLEFIGDSVLNFLVSDHLVKLYPGLSPGQLTLLRSANTDTEKLARVAFRHGLHKLLRHKVTILEQQVEQLRRDIEDFPIHSSGLIDAPKILANVTESLVGAVYVDCGHSLDTVWKVFRKMLEPFITLETLGKHPVSELHEYCQKKGINVTFVRCEWKCGSRVQVWLEGQLMGVGSCNKKEGAKNRAAKAALANLKKSEHIQDEANESQSSY